MVQNKYRLYRTADVSSQHNLLCKLYCIAVIFFVWLALVHARPDKRATNLRETVQIALTSAASDNRHRWRTLVLPHPDKSLKTLANHREYLLGALQKYQEKLYSLQEEEKENDEKQTFHTDPVLVCPDGFQFNLQECIHEQLSTSKLGCPEGWQYSSGKCFGLEVTSPEFKCDEGYTIQKNNTSTVCVRDITAPFFAECPNGFVITSSKSCVRELKTEAAPKCKHPDYTLVEDGRCARLLTILPTRTCPSGFEFDENDGQCVKQVYRLPLVTSSACTSQCFETPTPQCPPGYHPEKGLRLCKKFTRQDIEKRCSEGFILSVDEEKCIGYTAVPPVSIQCPEGYQSSLKDQNCARLIKHKVNYSCPRGFILDRETCIRGRARKVPDMSCSSPALKLTIDRDENVPLCLESHTIPPASILCSEDSVLSDGKCLNVKTSIPLLFCNGVRVGDLRLCSTLASSKADILDVVSPTGFACPSSFILNNNGVCEKLLCDEGFIPNERDECVRIEITQPDIQCPPNLEYVSGICTGAQYFDPNYECPENFSAVLKEHSSEDNRPYCEMQEAAQPILKCPEAFFEVDNKCLRRQTQNAISVCRKDFDISGTRCIRQLERDPLIMCPSGARYLGGLDRKQEIAFLIRGKENSFCVTTTRVKASSTCPHKFSFDAKTQSCVIMQKDSSSTVYARDTVDDRLLRSSSRRKGEKRRM